MITKEKLMRIAAIAGDERGDPATRKIAMDKLAKYHKQYPELFKTAAPQKPKTFREYKDSDFEDNFEDVMDYENENSFFDLGSWKISSKGNLYRNVGLKTYTIFADDRYGGYKWCIAFSSNKTFSRNRFNSNEEAMHDLWEYLK